MCKQAGVSGTVTLKSGTNVSASIDVTARRQKRQNFEFSTGSVHILPSSKKLFVGQKREITDLMPESSNLTLTLQILNPF
mmetsp:Transcript_61260/g.111647  ORF Transcript_61260/g.111647 Transcript_61260/m.111647 type:complete len:80 (-) Transcript_61260:16-255(-)